MAEALTFEEFWTAPGTILDVRSPAEYSRGHIPDAVNFPLFTDVQRAQVGTCYKHHGRDAAVELGFELVGPKLADLIRQARALSPDQYLRLHCWRGGMRSGAMAWALTLAGFKVITLAGGYKAFRSWVRRVLAVPKPMIVVGGMTGTAKTDILQALDQLGEPVLDLEALANHRGSSYGALGMPPQPSTEQFENLIADCWRSFSPQRPIWVEAESRRIGTCRIPDEIVHQMEQAPTLEITRPLEERLTLLVQLYGQADPDALIEATERIRRRLGGQRTQAAVQLIRQGNLKAAVAISLDYYDRTYRYDLERRQQTIPAVEVSGLSALESAQKLLAQVQRWGWH